MAVQILSMLAATPFLDVAEVGILDLLYSVLWASTGPTL